MANLLDLDPYLAVAEPLPPAGDDRLRATLAWAVLAPSPHNTQAWEWSVADGVVELRADRSRLLTVSDPDGRELVIGCGAALEQLLLRLGIDAAPVRVETLPDTGLLARVTVGPGEPYERRPDLVGAIPTRRTNRSAYLGEPMDPGLRSTLSEACTGFGVAVRWLADPAERTVLAEMIMDADREQMASADFRRELAHWMRPRHSRSDDGMQADLLGQHGVAAYVAPLVVRTFDVGKMQAARDRELTEGSPDLAVLSTTTDDPAAWLAAGRALARLTLEAEAAGLASAYMNQPCEVPGARVRLTEALSITGSPQLILRFGRAEPTRPASRLPVSQVLRR